MSRYNHSRDTRAVLDAAQQWIRTCLIEGGSLLGDKPLWQVATIDELVREFTDKPDESASTFFEKLDRQMAPASPDAKCLMAEMLWTLMLFQSGTRPAKKREQISHVWGWSGRSLDLAQPMLSDAAMIGIGNPGAAYNTMRWRELNYLIGLAKDLQSRSRDEREGILTDRERFEDWIETAPMIGYRQFRHVFRYLAFPDYIEPITQNKDRKLILERMGGMDAASLKTLSNKRQDEEIYKLRKALERELGTTEIDFYSSPLSERWRTVDTSKAQQIRSSIFEDGYQKLRRLFLKLYPDFDSFLSDARYAKDERTYKDELIELFNKDVLARLEEEDWRAAGLGAIGLLTKPLNSESGPQNIVGWRYQGVLTELRDDQRAEFGRDLADLINENEPVDSRVDHFVDRLYELAKGKRPPAASTTRSITGFYLALSDPSIHFFLKTRELQRAFRLVDPTFSWTPGRLTGADVLRVEELASQLFDRLGQEGWGIRDLFDVQSFLWAAMRANNEIVDDLEDDEEEETMAPQSATNTRTSPLNQILFGPPGTGKTYHTINKALEILDPEIVARCGNNPNLRKDLKARFDELVKQERIQFVTFHQSFSYEDFVEGLRADIDDQKGLGYRIESGVFKRICEAASGAAEIGSALGIREGARIWKISIDGTGPSTTRDYCFEHDEARIGWGEVGDLRSQNLASEPEYQLLGSNDRSTLEAFSTEMQEGDVVLCISSATALQAIGVVQGSYRFEAQPPPGVQGHMGNVLPVRWIARDEKLDIRPLNGGVRFTLKTIYEITRFSWPELAAVLESANIKLKGVAIKQPPKDHVLIIDEINRGNISRIFGELITLIETSKRAGESEQLRVVLPYSKKPFSVPNNVYLIGTMNTADRSLAGLDIALRRRFEFIEMPADPKMLAGVVVQGVELERMLEKMNERIEILLDRDHQLGHAYFMGLTSASSLFEIAGIFRKQILPLLQEYFFEDWQRIHWVLNDHRKVSDHQFVVESTVKPASVFGSEDSFSGDTKRWRIQSKAFEKAESYRGIVEAAVGA